MAAAACVWVREGGGCGEGSGWYATTAPLCVCGLCVRSASVRGYRRAGRCVLGVGFGQDAWIRSTGAVHQQAHELNQEEERKSALKRAWVRGRRKKRSRARDETTWLWIRFESFDNGFTTQKILPSSITFVIGRFSQRQTRRVGRAACLCLIELAGLIAQLTD